ncbi:MAG: galactofuranosyltransferase [Duncaniella sp.]|nr:galactofuranosyltransferase [Duncaniella sp.]
MKSFISKNYRHINTAGDKAKTDIEAIMTEVGYTNIGMAQSRSTNSLVAYFKTLASILRGVSRIKKGDIVVLQYPLKKYYDFVVKKATDRGAKVITLIHDLGSFRRKKLTEADEVERLNRSAVVIVHTEAMRRWLSERGVRVPMIVLGLFDYLSKFPARKDYSRPDGKPKLMFAGNCSRRANGWIYALAETAPNVEIILYGNGVEDQAPDNITAMGQVDSDTLIGEAQGDYGVVWYGESLDEGAGPLGEYLRYNAPHKTSMYLRAGIPVVIWDKAALADIVKRLDVGICIPSLRNIEEVLSAITPERYSQMRANALAAAEKLSSGGFTSDALAKSVDIINGSATATD